MRVVDGYLVLAEVPKNSNEAYLVRAGQNAGRDLVDLRIFDTPRTGGLVYTPRGVWIRPVLLPAVIAGLAEAEAHARREGWL